MLRTTLFLVLLAGLVLAAVGCSDNDTPLAPTGVAEVDKDAVVALDTQIDPMAGGNRGGFRHAPTLYLDGEAYYMDGAPDGPDGATDIPGHYWVLSGTNKVQGKHFNTGPAGVPNWWASGTEDGALLYKVNGIIDTWSEEKAMAYAEEGYVHYHEMVRVSDGALHPELVVWLKHIAVRHFNLDGGPHPELAHNVSPGVDYEFIPNGMTPYTP
jgi:hypothetical protein